MAAYAVRAPDGVIAWFNSRAAELWGRVPVAGDTDERFCGSYKLYRIDGTYMAHSDTPVAVALATGASFHEEEAIIERPDGRRITVSVHVDPILDTDGAIVGVLNFFHDITERKRGEGLLKEREISAHLLRLQDEERRHIARELHDSAGQTLIVLGMNLEQIEYDAKRDPDHLATAIHDARKRLQRLSEELRTTSYLLHPPLLDDMGLSSALRLYMEGLIERSGLEIELRIADNLGRLPSQMELAIFRLVQECLTNIHRHSGSKTAQIRVAREPDRIYVEVQDQGKGMSPKQIAEVQSGGGVGITGMRERVRQLHGELFVESDIDGTRIIATFPLAKHATA